jgi:hypothetical protein
MLQAFDKLMGDEEHFAAEFSANKGWFSKPE